jgi:hypothetical protein
MILLGSAMGIYLSKRRLVLKAADPTRMPLLGGDITELPTMPTQHMVGRRVTAADLSTGQGVVGELLSQTVSNRMHADQVAEQGFPFAP